MKKDVTITSFISRLRTEIDFKQIDTVDYWEADFCAIGFKKGDKLIYVSTFNFLTDAIIKYDYDLELLDKTEGDKIKVLKSERGVSEENLIFAVKTFFDFV